MTRAATAVPILIFSRSSSFHSTLPIFNHNTISILNIVKNKICQKEQYVYHSLITYNVPIRLCKL
jgi:hypothetical protein